MRLRFEYDLADAAFIDEETDALESAGDEFACLEEPDCPVDPRGHLFLTSCGKTRCVRCGELG